MKVLTLNAWSGKLTDDLMAFIGRSNGYDVICLQEVTRNDAPENWLQVVPESDNGMRQNLFEAIGAVLPEHTGYFSRAVRNVLGAEGQDYGVAVFLTKRARLIEYRETFVHAVECDDAADKMVGHGNHARTLQSVRFSLDGKSLTVHNLHGLWNGGGKGDAPERLKQSEKVVRIMESFEGEQVLCGDFNLWPETESLAMLAKGNRNLILENGITSTRSPHYEKENKFADYVIVTPGLKVASFEVLPDIVSDHLALSVEIDL